MLPPIGGQFSTPIDTLTVLSTQDDAARPGSSQT